MLDQACVAEQSPVSTSKTPEWGVPAAGAGEEDGGKEKKPKAAVKGWRGLGEFQVNLHA